jgi:hypothetical protein
MRAFNARVYHAAFLKKAGGEDLLTKATEFLVEEIQLRLDHSLRMSQAPTKDAQSQRGMVDAYRDCLSIIKIDLPKLLNGEEVYQDPFQK